MSVATEITRIQTAKANLKTSIEAKGVTVSSSALIDAYSAYVDAIPSGGGIVEEKDVNFYDWDGTLLYSYTIAEARSLSALPVLPTGPTGYTAQSWTETLSFINSLTTIWNVGVNYSANNRYSNFYISIKKPETTICISTPNAYYNPYTIDWGSENITTVVTGDFYHTTYHAAGDYVIKVDCVEGNNAYSLRTGYYGVSGANQPFIFDENNYVVVNPNTKPNCVVLELIKKVELGYGAVDLPYKCFLCCSVEKMVIPTSLQYNSNIRSMFSGSNIKHITIPSTMTALGNYLFSEYYNLESVVVPSTATFDDVNSMYKYCNRLKRAFLPTVSGSIGGAFNDCNSLEKTVENITTTAISSYYHYGNHVLREISIPASIDTIGEYAFYHCNQIKSVTIPSAVREIGSSAFMYCYSIETLIIENGITEIGGTLSYQKSFIFGDCVNLREVNIPNSVTLLGYSLFNGCKTLEKVTIGVNIQRIVTNAFYNCSSLKTVIINATTPPTLDSNAFYNTPIASGAGTVYVPAGSVADYQSAQYWSSFNIQAIPN